MNVGNDIVYYDRLPEGTYIIVDNLVSSCPQLHKANYRINIEPWVAGKNLKNCTHILSMYGSTLL